MTSGTLECCLEVIVGSLPRLLTSYPSPGCRGRVPRFKLPWWFSAVQRSMSGSASVDTQVRPQATGD
jgi:hypothetical protein